MGITGIRIATNTGIILCGNLVIGLLSFLTNIIYVRYLGAGSYGVYSLVFTYLTFFTIIIDFGTSSIIVREVARDAAGAPKLLGNCLLMRLALSCLAMALAAGVLIFLRYPLDTKMLIMIGSLSFLFSIQNVYRLVFQASLHTEYMVGIDIAITLVRCALFLMLVYVQAGLVWFVAAEVAVNAPGLALGALFSRRFVAPRFTFDKTLWRYMFRESWPLALSSVFVLIYARIDQLMLYQMKGPQEVGYYAVVVKLSEVFNVIPSAFMVSVFPLFAQYFMSSRQELTHAYRLSAKAMMAIIIPIACGTTVLAPKIIRFFYGDAFAPAAPALGLLLWAEVFIFAGLVNNRLLISVNQQRIDFVYTSTAAVVNVLLNMLFIPRWGLVGAAGATLIAYATGPVMNCVLRRIRTFGLIMFAQMFKPLVAGLLMSMCLLQLHAANLMVSVGIGIMLYTAAMFLMKGITWREISIVMKK